MTENIIDSLSYDWRKLELAEVAQDYLSQGPEAYPLAQKSLELLLDDINFSDPGIMKTVTDPEVIHKTIKNELDIYIEGYKTQTVEDIFDYDLNANLVEKYLGEDSGKVKEKLKAFLNKNYSDIEKSVKKAQHILKGEELEANSDEEIKEAKATQKEYKDVYSTIETLKQKRKSDHRVRVEDEMYKDFFKATYLTPPKEEKEK